MIWFYERESQEIEYEIREQPEGGGYELVISGGEGSPHVERFDNPARLIERSLEIQQDLRRSGWRVPDLRRQRTLLRDRGLII